MSTWKLCEAVQKGTLICATISYTVVKAKIFSRILLNVTCSHLRLGLGASLPSSKTSAAALASANSAEGKMLKAVLQGGQKRKALDEAPIAGPSRLTRNTGALMSKVKPDSDDDEEESRSSAIGSKSRRQQLAKMDFFHDKSRSTIAPQDITLESTAAPLTKKQKKRLKQAARTCDKEAEETFIKPRTPQGNGVEDVETAPELPVKAIDPPLAFDPKSLTCDPPIRHHEEEKPVSSDDDESIVTEATVTQTAIGTPTRNDADPKKKRKKKKKKKKLKLSEDAALVPKQEENGMLFGDSILD